MIVRNVESKTSDRLFFNFRLDYKYAKTQQNTTSSAEPIQTVSPGWSRQARCLQPCTGRVQKKCSHSPDRYP